VLNEAMKDEVKITVIATGFQRDNLPQLVRRGEPIEVMAAAPPPAPPPPVVEPVVTNGSLFLTPEPEVEEPAAVAMDDLEIPAFIRRERRLYQ